MKYFDGHGRRIPTSGMRVFSEKLCGYYKIPPLEISFSDILERSKKFGGVPDSFTLLEFKDRAENLLGKLKTNSDYENLLKGVHIPFIYFNKKDEGDIGSNLETILLPNLQKSFNDYYPDAHFKAVLQSNSELPNHITCDSDSRYDEFISATKKGAVVGWFFPQALQEFDIQSQRKQMSSLPKLVGANICLSGGMDVCSALTGMPNLLISEEYYAPILCLSAYVHSDKRLVLLLKSYGPHMEFWCMTQMLTKEVTQVSEQWAGGLTVYDTN